MLKNIGTTEIIVIAVVLLLLFGGKMLPALSKKIIDSIKEFKKNINK